MKNLKCDFEAIIIESKANDCLTTEQEEHIKNCSICSDSLTVFSWMNKFEKISNKEAEQTLPNPDHILKQAFAPISNKKDLIKKAMRPLAIAQFTSYITIFIVIVFILLGKHSILKKFLGNIAEKSDLINSLTTLFNAFSKTLPFLIVPLGMVAFLLVSYFIYSLFSPENA